MSTQRERRERAELEVLLRDIWQTDPEASLSEWAGLVEQALRKLASVCCGVEPEETDADRDTREDDGEFPHDHGDTVGPSDLPRIIR